MKIRIMQPVVFLALLSALFSSIVLADETLTGTQIIEKSLAANYYAGLDRTTKGKMTITDKNGSVRIREFRVARLNEAENASAHDDQNYFVKFNHPNDLDGVVFMVKKHVGNSDDRWLFLPKLDLVRRIAAGDKRTSFVGSDVLYEDVSGRHPMDDTHELDSESKSYYIVKSIPKDPSLVEFQYYKTWVHKTTFLALKREYYDASDKLYRQLKVDKVAEVKGIPTVMNSTVRDFNTGSVTTVACDNVNYNVGVTEDLFSERNLRNPPSKYFDK